MFVQQSGWALPHSRTLFPHSLRSVSTYSSAANSYLAFCKLHHLPVDPTPETLSYYITFQSAHINPKSVESYLSSICSCLEPFFLDIRPNRATALIKRTLKDACRHHSQPTVQKSPLTTTHLCTIANTLHNLHDHDDMLFLCMINTGFTGLLQLSEMTVSNTLHLRDSHKVVSRSSLSWVDNVYEFLLPAHKADTTFKGNRAHIACIINAPNPQSFHEVFHHVMQLHVPPPPTAVASQQRHCADVLLVSSSPECLLPSQYHRAVNTCRWCHCPRRGQRSWQAHSRGRALVLGCV